MKNDINMKKETANEVRKTGQKKDGGENKA